MSWRCWFRPHVWFMSSPHALTCRTCERTELRGTPAFDKANADYLAEQRKRLNLDKPWVKAWTGKG